MRKVIYSMGVSLDGFIAGPDGEIDWSAPDEELHRFHNQHTREMGAHLYGRRLYEVMAYWETADEKPSAPDHELVFARIWKNMPKIVFSKTLEKVEGNARLVRDGVAEAVAELKEQRGKDLAVGGAGLAVALDVLAGKSHPKLIKLTPEVWDNTSSAGVSTLQSKYDASLDPYYSVQYAVAPYTTYSKAQLIACQS